VRLQVALQRLELLAVLEADDVVGRDRLLDRDGRLLLLWRRARRGRAEPYERGMHAGDELRQIVRTERIVAHIGAHNVGRTLYKIGRRLLFRHIKVLPFLTRPPWIG